MVRFDRDTHHRRGPPVAISPDIAVGRNHPPRDKLENAMTVSEMIVSDKKVRELTAEELEVVSGGRMKIPMPDAVKAYLIARIERDNPGF